MNSDRRRFVTTTAVLAATQLLGARCATAQSRRNGSAPVTGADIDALARQRSGAQLTCVRTPESNDGPSYYTSSLRRRALAEGRNGVPLKIATTQLYFPDEFIDELYAGADPYRRHLQRKVPGAERILNRLRNEDDGGYLADQSTPMPIRREADVVIAEATIGIVTLGSFGVAPLFR